MLELPRRSSILEHARAAKMLEYARACSFCQESLACYVEAISGCGVDVSLLYRDSGDERFHRISGLLGSKLPRQSIILEHTRAYSSILEHARAAKTLEYARGPMFEHARGAKMLEHARAEQATMLEHALLEGPLCSRCSSMLCSSIARAYPARAQY